MSHNANVNAVDLWKFTPLHEAAAKGKYEICKLLIKVCGCFRCVRYVSVCVMCLLSPLSMEEILTGVTVIT